MNQAVTKTPWIAFLSLIVTMHKNEGTSHREMAMTLSFTPSGRSNHIILQTFPWWNGKFFYIESFNYETKLKRLQLMLKLAIFGQMVEITYETAATERKI